MHVHVHPCSPLWSAVASNVRHANVCGVAPSPSLAGAHDIWAKMLRAGVAPNGRTLAAWWLLCER